MNRQETKTPLIGVIVRRGERGAIRVTCPYCGAQHQHGWPTGDTRPAGRISRCVSGERRCYWVAPLPATTPLAATRREVEE